MGTVPPQITEYSTDRSRAGAEFTSAPVVSLLLGEYGISTVFLENYWNDGSPQLQERTFDSFVVSTRRIGC